MTTKLKLLILVFVKDFKMLTTWPLQW